MKPTISSNYSLNPLINQDWVDLLNHYSIIEMITTTGTLITIQMTITAGMNNGQIMIISVSMMTTLDLNEYLIHFIFSTEDLYQSQFHSVSSELELLSLSYCNSCIDHPSYSRIDSDYCIDSIGIIECTSD